MNEKDELDLFRKILEGIPEERKLHYTFAYQGLPGQFFAAPDLMWEALKKARNNEKLIKEMWRLIAEIGQLTLFEAEGLKSEFRETEQFEIVSVIMPTPEYIPEAYYCLIFKVKESLDYQYFTIEYSGSSTVLGSINKDLKRKSLGNVPDNSLDACLRQAIRFIEES